jgi:hypothetical protein
MTKSRRDRIDFGNALPAIIRDCLPDCLAIFLGVALVACTPATPDSPLGSGGSAPPAGSSGGAPASSGTGGSTGSGSGGSTNVDPTASGGAVGSGATSGGSSGGAIASGGSQGAGSGGASGGRNGSGGSAIGGSAPAMGCNWIDDPVAKTARFMEPAAAAKIVLFDGTTSKKGPAPVGWHKQSLETDPTKWLPIDWTVEADNTLLVKRAGTQAVEVQSNMRFEDLCVHVEYLTPDPSTYRTPTDLQTHGNSGVYLKSAYEMQILDTFGLAVVDDGCGAIYKLKAPYSSACFQYGNWNTYEIEFKGSVWSGATRTKNAQFVKVALNGTVVQGVASWIPGSVPFVLDPVVTSAGTNDLPGPQPLGLQDHLDPVKFRNIWVTVPKY